MSDEHERKVRSELNEVLDPCSTFTDNPVSIVDLGIVDEVVVADGTANVTLLPTNQMCLYIMNMADEITDRLQELDFIDNVEVTQETDKVWTPMRMTETERQYRNRAFRQKVNAYGIEPHDYSSD